MKVSRAAAPSRLRRAGRTAYRLPAASHPGGAGEDRGPRSGADVGLVEKRLAEIGTGRPLCIFLDYDGTLVPIRQKPGLAALHPARRRLLERLSGTAFVCVVSGRSLANLKERVGIPGLSYVGNHGLEIRHGGRTWVHPKARTIEPKLEEAAERIEAGLAVFPGAFVERKGVTASVHHRNMAPRLLPRLKAAVRRAIAPAGSRILLAEGKKVLELLPNVAWHKGRAVRKVLQLLKPGPGAALVYIGDDRTDEDAFAMLGRKAVTVRVGSRGPTRAEFRLPDVASVWRLLGRLAAVPERTRRED